MAELRRWEDLRPELDKWGVRLITLSVDTPEQIREGKSKHGAQATLLADSELKVIRQLGLENTATNIKRSGLEGVPIPTTILVDSDHIVRWVDQSEDHQVRSAPDRVRAAIVDALGEPG